MMSHAWMAIAEYRWLCGGISGRDVMHNPVIAADGHTYERRAIRRWMCERMCSPLTNEPLESNMLRPDNDKRNKIQQELNKLRTEADDTTGIKTSAEDTHEED